MNPARFRRFVIVPIIILALSECGGNPRFWSAADGSGIFFFASLFLCWLFRWFRLHSPGGIALLLLPALLLFGGCKEKARMPMRIGTDVWPGYEPLFLAREAGQLPEKDFRLVEFSNSSAVGRAFRNGTIEAGCLTLDEAFYLVQNGLDPVIVLVLDESNGADVLLAKPEFKSLAELKGKRIGVEVSAVETYTLTRALQRAGLTVKDVQPVYLPVEEHVDAFQAGRVDAVVTFEPVRTKLLALGAVDLFNSSMIPGEIVDVLVVRRDFLEKNPERIARLKQAWFAALAQMRQAPAKTAAIMATREQTTAADFAASLRGLNFPDEEENRAMLAGNPPKLLETAERLQSVMRASGLLSTDIQVRSLFDFHETRRPPP